jgi:hypothetical protein
MCSSHIVPEVCSHLKRMFQLEAVALRAMTATARDVLI